jgi:hypothetical protein
MRASWCVPAHHETNHELIWLGVSLLSLASAALWLASGLPWPRCVFLWVTGHPCVTCGATRAAIQLFHGHFLAAFAWNPLVFAILCGVMIFDVYAIIVLIAGPQRFRIVEITPAEKNFVRLCVVILLVLNWVYLLSHGRNFV